MEFMKWLNSLDELLYEVMSWLVFFPVTLWRSMIRPLGMMEYARLELHADEELSFEDTLSPPLFLFLALLLSHALALALGNTDDEIIRNSRGLAGLVDDNTSLLMLRLAFFSLFPLIFAVILVRTKGKRLTREELKAPFYAQCYAAAPFALLLGAGTSLVTSPRHPEVAVGLGIIGAIIVWYLAVQTFWLRKHLATGILRACSCAAAGFLISISAGIGVGWLFLGQAS